MKKNQFGFAHLGLILLLITMLGIVVFVGWKVSSKDKPAVITNANDKSSAKADDTTSANSKTVPTLAIKEWGISIPLSQDDENAYYKIEEATDQQASYPEITTIYSKETDALVGPAGKSCAGEYIAFILRLHKDDARWQESTSFDDRNVSPLYYERKVIGEYRYGIATDKSYGPECFETNPSGDYIVDQITASKFENVVNTFAEDFKNVQKQ